MDALFSLLKENKACIMSKIAIVLLVLRAKVLKNKFSCYCCSIKVDDNGRERMMYLSVEGYRQSLPSCFYDTQKKLRELKAIVSLTEYIS